MDYLFDTCSVSAIIKQNEKMTEKMRAQLERGEKRFISIITDYEINRGLFAINATRQLKIYESLRHLLNILWIDDLELSKKAAEIHANLKQRGQLIQDADILIAATALINNLTVITDDKHFSRIPNLKVENWLRE